MFRSIAKQLPEIIGFNEYQPQPLSQIEGESINDQNDRFIYDEESQSDSLMYKESFQGYLINSSSCSEG